jgi:hypothetical protein
MQVQYTPESTLLVCPPNTLLPVLSFGIESATNWYFGHGCSSLEIVRKSNFTVAVKPLAPLKEFQFSRVAPLSELVRSGYWPKDIPFDKLWKVPGERQEIRDGHARLFRYNKENCIMQSFGMLSNTPLSEVSWGLADFTVGMFWFGATYVKWQQSMQVCQMQCDKGFTEEEMIHYISDTEPGYSLNQTVSTLP